MHDVLTANTLGLQSIVFILCKGFAVLTTQQEHELPMFPFTSGAGVATWRAVTLHLGTPYIFIHYAIKQGRDWLSQTTICWRYEDVLGFCRGINNDKKRKVLSVFMLVPPPHEHSHGWTFVPIEEILVRKLEGDEEEDHLPIFVTVGGEIFRGLKFAPVDDPASYEELNSLERVFRANSDVS